MQETVAEAFVKCFQLTPEEVAVIKGSSRESPITPEFFTVLDKTQKIRSNTKYLLQVSSVAVLMILTKDIKRHIQRVGVISQTLPSCIVHLSLCSTCAINR